MDVMPFISVEVHRSFGRKYSSIFREKVRFACPLPVGGLLLGLLFVLQDGSSMFFCIICNVLPDYTALHSRSYFL
jgi:hypothetical protein